MNGLRSRVVSPPTNRQMQVQLLSIKLSGVSTKYPQAFGVDSYGRRGSVIVPP